MTNKDKKDSNKQTNGGLHINSYTPKKEDTNTKPINKSSSNKNSHKPK